MEMTMRWYGSKFDTVTLKQIRQVPGVTGVITTLYDTKPGEVWSRARIKDLKKEVAAQSQIDRQQRGEIALRQEVIQKQQIVSSIRASANSV